MIKVFAFIAKRRDISEQQFHSHWREPHGRLTKAVGQIQRYIQNHAIGGAGELSGLALFLVSGEARFISGAGLHVDGGARVNF